MASVTSRSRTGSHCCVFGAQWGDEGKGKIVDALCAEFDVVVRYQGGANAGHTVLIGADEFIFHLVPSGIIQEDKVCVIGNGVVIDPKSLVEELDGLRGRGLDHEKNLWISDRAHVVMPYHRQLDRLRESANGKPIGTTLRGIGPCYADKSARRGIRMADLVNPARFESTLRTHIQSLNRELSGIHGEEPLRVEDLLSEYASYSERLRPRVRNITDLLWDMHSKGARLLFEGAQGALLDIDLGTYPYVTSSNTSFLGLGAGTGFSPRQIQTVLGITKAYTTRVGEGPFPTELEGPLGDSIREAGGEYGATTGRPRRCGWLDLVALRYTIQFGDIDALAITKLDVLDQQETIEVAVSYGSQKAGEVAMPPYLESLALEYRSFPGWQTSTAGCRSLQDLPEKAREYLQFIADFSRCPIAMVSVGKERTQLIRFDPWLEPRNAGGNNGG